MYGISMYIRMVNPQRGRFVHYEYGTDLFGNIYLEKIKGKKLGQTKTKRVGHWILPDYGSLVRLLDLEIYRREMENYFNHS